MSSDLTQHPLGGAPSASGLQASPGLRRAILETAALPGVTATAIAARFGWSVGDVHRELRTALRELRADREQSAPS